MTTERGKTIAKIDCKRFWGKQETVLGDDSHSHTHRFYVMVHHECIKTAPYHFIHRCVCGQELRDE